ncbi:MAG TPA: type II secretion system F family protein [Candidatus Saccharimonadales bacterium]|nr:type II secretion system F family protein [Candidatus Saccharimonadales bacterium]
MATFAYTARDKTGAVMKGSLFALDRATAAANLIEKGLAPILVKEESPAGSKRFALPANFGLGQKVKLKDKVIFSRQFATMVNAGVPMSKSLSILKEQTVSKKLQAVVGDLAKRVEGGSALAAALEAHPEVFSSVYINMVKAGETGGILDDVLNRLAIQQEKDAEIVSKVRGAMIYPSVVTSATIAAFVFLMTSIVPKLGTIFEGLGAELPIYTRILLGTSKALTQYGIFIALALGGAGFLLARYIKTKSGKKQFDALLLKAPIFGNIVSKVNIARFARTFGSLMSSGISVLDALGATASALGNSVFKQGLEAVAVEVKNGKPIAECLRRNPNFPPIVAQMIAVGEETGQLDEILLKLAEFYEKEVDSIIAGMTSIIEPILIMVIGAMIGFIIVSVFGPLSALSTAI